MIIDGDDHNSTNIFFKCNDNEPVFAAVARRYGSDGDVVFLIFVYLLVNNSNIVVIIIHVYSSFIFIVCTLNVLHLR